MILNAHTNNKSGCLAFPKSNGGTIRHVLNQMPTFSDFTADAENETGNPSVFLANYQEKPKGHTHISMYCWPLVIIVIHVMNPPCTLLPMKDYRSVQWCLTLDALGLALHDFMDSSLNSPKHDLALIGWVVASPSDELLHKLIISPFLVVGKFSCNQLEENKDIKWRLHVKATGSDVCWLRALPHMFVCGMYDSQVIGRILSQGTSRIFSIAYN